MTENIMNAKHDVIIGIDASLTHTGISVISVDDGVHIERICVPKTRGAERLKDIEEWFSNLFIELEQKYQYTIKISVLEGYAFTPRFGQSFSLGELGGVIKLFLYKRNIKLFTVAPQTLKKFATGSGKGDKNMMLLKAFKKWGVEFNNDHTCDAFSLAMIGKAIYEIENKIKDIKQYFDYEQEVIKLIMKQIEE